MSPTSHLPELDQLRNQVASLARELAEQDQAFRQQNRRLDDELRDLREQSDILHAIITSTAAETGEDFFQTLVLQLCEVFGVQYAMVGEVHGEAIKKIRTIAVSVGGILGENFEYPLTHTPCESALTQSFTCFERDVCTSFPTFERLAQLHVEGYCGVPLKAKDGTVIGLLAVMDTKPLEDTQRLKSLMTVFASRAVAELLRRQAEAELRASQEKLRQALQASGTGLWHWNTDTNEVNFSEEWKRQLGYGATELPDALETWTTLLHPDDREGAIAYARRYQTSPGGDYRQEFRLRHKDGTYRWIEARASFATEADGRRVRLLGSHTDITDRKRIDDSLRESEERYRTLVELSPCGAFVFCDGRTVYVNHMGTILMGASDPQEILDRPTFDFIHPNYHHEVRENVKRLLSGGVSVHSAERVYLKMDGTPIPVQVEAAQILWNGKPAILGLFSDITERKLGEDRMREMNLALAQAMPGISRVSLDGRYLEVNQPYAAMLGYEPVELLGRSWEPTVHPEDLVIAKQAYEELLEKGKAEFESRAVRKDGTIFYQQVLMVLSKPTIGGLLGHHCFMRDITERKRAEDALANLNVTLEQQVNDRTEALRRSEERFRQFFDHAPNATALKDQDGRYLYTNRQFDKVFGLESGMAIGKTDAQVFSPEQAVRFGGHDREVLTRGRGQEFEEVTQQEDGIHTSIVVKFPVTDAFGELYAIGSIATDITERKRTQEQLRLYQEIFTHSIDGIAVIDLQGHYILQNRAHEELLGFTMNELEGKTPAIHLGEELFAHIGRELTKTGRYRGELESRTKCGTVLTLDLTAFVVKDAKGQPVCYVDITRDVTERNRAQEALWESEARWQQFAESVGSAFWIAEITPDERKVLYVNSAFTVIWGIERDEIYQNWSLWLDSIHPDDRMRVKASHDRFIAGDAKAAFHCEYRIVGRDGHIRWISDRRVRMAGWDHRVAGIAEDITHDRQRLALMAQTEAIAQIGGWELDIVSNSLWWSEETYRLHETTPEQYQPTVETALRFYTPESLRSISKALGKGTTQGTPWDLELEVISAKGRRIPVRVAGKVDVLDGRAVRAYGTFQDITDRKRAEDALRRAHDELERKVIERTAELQASQERFARATAVGKVGVWELDVIKGEYHGDTNLKALFGYAPEELSGDPSVWLNLVHPDDRTIATKNWELLQGGISDLCHYELRHIKKDGSVVWGDVRGRSVRDGNGRLTHVIGATVDITERKEAEEALRESEERFAKAFRASPNPIGITELATGRCIEVNDACLQVFGFHREEVIGNTTLMLGIWPNQEERAGLVERLKAGQPVRNLELALRTKSGEVRHFLASCDLTELDGTVCMITVGNDITERKRAAEALQRSERDLRTVLDALPIGVWFTDRNGTPIVSNPASQRMWTSARKVEWVSGGQKWIESTEQTTGPHRWALSRVLANGEPSLNEVFEVDCGHEGTRTILNSAVPVRGEDGAVLGAVVLNEDISDRVKAEDALRQNHALLSAIMDASVDLIYVKDLDGRYVHMNRAGADALGMPVEDIVGCDDLTLWGIKLATSSMALDRRVIESGETITVEERGIVQGKQVYYLTTKAPYRDPENRIIGVIGVSRDITERKQAEEALRKSEERFAKAFQASLHPVVITEMDSGRLVDANEAAYQMFGYRKEDVEGKTTLQIGLWHSVEERARYLARLRQQGFVRNVEVQLRRRNGEVRRCLLSSELIELNGKQCCVTVGDDITERKRAEEALRASEERLRSIFQYAGTGIAFADAKGRFIQCNHAYSKIVGYTEEELCQATFQTLIHPEDYDHNIALVEQLVSHAIPSFEVENRYLHKNGHSVLVHQFVTALRGQDDKLTHFIALVTDISDRKRAEEALRTSEERLRLALSAANLGLYDLDLQTGLAQVNDEYATMLGYDPSSFEETHAFWQERLHPDDRDRVLAISDAYIRGESPSYKVEARQRTKSGEWRWIASIGQIMNRDPEGRPLRMVGVYFDITERKRAEEDLRRSHQFIRQVIDTDPNFIFAKDPEGRFTLVNKAVADCYGCTVEELIGKSDADFNPDPEEVTFFRQKDREVMESLQDRFMAEEKITDYKGKVRWLQTVKRPMLDELGRAHMVLGAATDITERKEMEEMLRERERELREALQERERISQDLHDGILQSLYAIGLGLEASKLLIEPPPEKTAPKLTMSLNRAIGQLNHVMAEVRNFIAGLESQVMQGGDFATALRTMVQMMSSSSAARCHVRIDPDATRHISTEQALHILNIVREGLSNALRHSQATRITVSLRVLTRSIRLTVTDDGVGFRPDSAHGGGHGLANMAARAQKVGGLFSVRSEPQKGTRINLDIEKDAHYAYN